jgi:hypothetical protein
MADSLEAIIALRERQSKKADLARQTERAAHALTAQALSEAPLAIFSAHFEADPDVAYSWPCSAAVWSALLPYHRKKGPAENLPVSEVAQLPPSWELFSRGATAFWLVVQSTHTTAAIVVHAEDLRQVMGHVSHMLPHCVVGAEAVTPSDQFWSSWAYKGLLEQRARNRESALGNVQYSTRGFRGGSAPRFPGELLRPLGSTSLVASANPMSEYISH